MKKSDALPKEHIEDLPKTSMTIAGITQNLLRGGGQSDALIFENEKEVLFRTFIRKIPAAIAIFDKEFNYIITSDRWRKETALSSKDIKGKNIYDVVPDLPKKWRKIHQRALEGEHLKSENDQFKRKDGSSEWWKWEILPWHTSQGSIGGIILFVELISKHKILEKKMKDTIKALNRSNAELKRFAHICAHDLNEPLRTIASYSRIVEVEFKEQLNLEAKKYLESITKSIKHMNTLVNGILGYSQFETFGLNKSFFSLQHIINSVKLILEKKIEDKRAFIHSDMMPMIYGDLTMIARVFQNLISNSLKFNESDLPIIYISVKEKKKEWLFIVEDNGIGIDPKYHHKIFELFARLHNTSKYEGTGIGLSISKKIIEAHGGKIWVKSSLHNGSQFFFSLPKVKSG